MELLKLLMKILHPDCHSNQENQRCRQELNDSAAVLFNKTCLTTKQAAAVASLRANRTFISPSEEYFINGVLQDSGDFEVMGDMSYSLAACLFTAWVIVFLCVMKGVKSSGKVKIVFLQYKNRPFHFFQVDPAKSDFAALLYTFYYVILISEH